MAAEHFSWVGLRRGWIALDLVEWRYGADGGWIRATHTIDDRYKHPGNFTGRIFSWLGWVGSGQSNPTRCVGFENSLAKLDSTRKILKTS